MSPDPSGTVDPDTENQDGPSKNLKNKDISSLEQLDVLFKRGLERNVMNLDQKKNTAFLNCKLSHFGVKHLESGTVFSDSGSTIPE